MRKLLRHPSTWTALSGVVGFVLLGQVLDSLKSGAPQTMPGTSNIVWMVKVAMAIVISLTFVATLAPLDLRREKRFRKLFVSQDAVDQHINALRRDVREWRDCYSWALNAAPDAVPKPEDALRDLRAVEARLAEAEDAVLSIGYGLPSPRE